MAAVMLMARPGGRMRLRGNSRTAHPRLYDYVSDKNELRTAAEKYFAALTKHKVTLPEVLFHHRVFGGIERILAFHRLLQRLIDYRRIQPGRFGNPAGRCHAGIEKIAGRL